MRTRALAFLLLFVASATGCASAMPSFAGGSTTPERRTDLAIGGAARVPTGDLRVEKANDPAIANYQQAVNAGGIVPAAYARFGLRRGYDIGLLASGSLVRVDARRETVLREKSTRVSVVYAASPFVGFIPQANAGDGRGQSVGVHVPCTLSLDIGGLYDVWFGPRVDFEYVWGDFANGSGVRTAADAFGLRSGAVLGIAAGVRRVHALLELTAAWEQWWGDQGGASLNRGGIVLIPAFALRVRL